MISQNPPITSHATLATNKKVVKFKSIEDLARQQNQATTAVFVPKQRRTTSINLFPRNPSQNSRMSTHNSNIRHLEDSGHTHKPNLSIDSGSSSLLSSHEPNSTNPRFSFLSTVSSSHFNQTGVTPESSTTSLSHTRTSTGHNSNFQGSFNLSFGSKRHSVSSNTTLNGQTKSFSKTQHPVITVTKANDPDEEKEILISSPTLTHSKGTPYVQPKRRSFSPYFPEKNTSDTPVGRDYKNQSSTSLTSRRSKGHGNIRNKTDNLTAKYERITNSLIQMFDNLQSSNQDKAQLIEKLQTLKTQNAKNHKKLEGLLNKIKQVENNFEIYDSKVENDCTLIMICMCLIKNI